MKIAVVGGGIIGLSSAVLLQEADQDVHVFSQNKQSDLTSSVAAAVVYPYGVEESPRLQKWYKMSENYLAEILPVPDAGVSQIKWMKCAYDEETRIAPFFLTLPNARELGAEHCPAGFAKGIAADIYMVNSQIHLPYALNRLRQTGGQYTVREISSISEISADFDLIINASGVYASTFVNDEDVQLGRGQVVIVRNPGIDHHFSTFEGRHYIYPRGDECILGGSMDWGEWDREPNDELTRSILTWAADFDPRFGDAEILDVRVGLRPMRPTVRLEQEIHESGTPVIHNYGHGGAGYTLAWGCAQVVRDMILPPETKDERERLAYSQTKLLAHQDACSDLERQ